MAARKRLPESITILGQQISVVLADLDGLHGDADPDKKTIRIDSKATLDEQWSHLFHEACHCALAIGGVSFALDDKLEEAIVRCIENGLAPLVKFK